MESLKTLVESLNNNSWLNLIFLLLAIVSIIVSFVLFIKGRKNRDPIYTIRTINLVREKIEKIKSIDILFKGSKVDNLSISKIAFWNNGKETINAIDVAPLDPIRICMKDGQYVLDAEIIYCKNAANNFTIEIDNEKNEVRLKFDYYDNNEGIVIQLFHTGLNSDDIEIRGTVKATSGIKRKDNRYVGYKGFDYLEKQIRKTPLKFRRYFLGSMAIVFAALLLISSPKEPNLPAKPLILWQKIFLQAFVLITFGSLSLYYFRRNIPKGFDVYEDEF